MASPAPAPPPRRRDGSDGGPPPPTLRLVPPLDRDRRITWIAVLLSLLLHVLLLLGATWWGRTHAVEPVPEQASRLPIRFVNQPQAKPADAPPDTNVVSEVDARADAPEPETPTEPQTPKPRTDGASLEPAMPRQPSPRPRPAQPAQPQPEPEQREERREPLPEPSDRPVTLEEKRARAAEILRGERPLQGSFDDLFSELPSEPLGDWGHGSLQFESRADVDWASYGERIQRIVRSNWRIPVAAKIGSEGATQVHFYIARDGSLEDIVIATESGVVPLDYAARDAISLSDALPPPPLPADGDEERVGVLWTFFYNMDAGERQRWSRIRRLEQRRAQARGGGS